MLKALFWGGFSALTPVVAWGQSLPVGGHYTAGSGVISSVNGGVTIHQESTRGIIDWHSFSIGNGRVVQFNNGTGATLNRVTGEQATAIQGRLGATGSVFLINPNGVVIGQNGQVITGGSFVDGSAVPSGKNGGHITVGVNGLGGGHLAYSTKVEAGASLRASGKGNGQGGVI
nr:filamentous hemagglutinin N-terminal domain-containing protein [Neokomagataea anthophila]